MMAPLTVSERDLGTPESSWLASPRLQGLRDLPLGELIPARRESGPPRVVVLAPHPDDEVLAVGGLLAMLCRAGWAIDLVAVTDGEGSHPRSRTVTPDQLVQLRAQERERALARLGIVDDGVTATVTRLHVADSRVSQEAELTARIGDHLRHVRGVSACLAPWSRDGHPDHDAVGRAAEEACGAAGVRLLQYPVWAWHWARPETPDLPWFRARRVVLAPAILEAKRSAIAAYRSQIAPLDGGGDGDEAILPPAVLARFERPFEVLFT